MRNSIQVKMGTQNAKRIRFTLNEYMIRVSWLSHIMTGNWKSNKVLGTKVRRNKNNHWIDIKIYKILTIFITLKYS